MILGTLGSDKSVTTVNAIMTEVFAGVKPDEIRIYREYAVPSRLDGLNKALNLLSLSPEIKEIVVGDDLDAWRNYMKGEQIDILDITPGRKSMALTSANYAQAKEVRYAYIRYESEGYRVFGYVPFTHLKLLDLRTEKSINLEPPPVRETDRVSQLTRDSLTALINILSLHGKVELDASVEEEDEELCRRRSGFVRFANEGLVRKKAEEGLIVADTNVYINLGTRLGDLARRGRELRLIPSRSVYDELLGKIENSSKDSRLPRFILGLESYYQIHRIPPRSKQGNYGDRSLLEELKFMKMSVAEKVIFVTGDWELGNKARAHTDTVILEGKKEGEGDWGTYLECLGKLQFKGKKPGILVNGETVATVEQPPNPSVSPDYRTIVKTLKPNLNYAKVLEALQW
ncbi:MAG: PIN domain-containing protein [Metallosphaera prunae]|uniref:PIN domain-containing protein n=1 Tax=Metallosphaera prunae TaxID=47304 RepID=UPI0022727E92|nr:PIN domain-containing protein [Metallosphaera prunae]MCY0860922.1 PIN domain-containing protein [Metallosphaera prunae]